MPAVPWRHCTVPVQPAAPKPSLAQLPPSLLAPPFLPPPQELFCAAAALQVPLKSQGAWEKHADWHAPALKPTAVIAIVRCVLAGWWHPEPGSLPESVHCMGCRSGNDR